MSGERASSKTVDDEARTRDLLGVGIVGSTLVRLVDDRYVHR